MSEAAFSLKRRLLATLLGTIALVWLGTAVYSYFDTRHEIRELLDAHLAQSASLIMAQAGEELEELDLEHVPQLHQRGVKVAFQVWEGGRELRVHSANSPEERLSSRDEGFSDAVIGGKGWRVFSAWDAARRYLVQVGERDETRHEIATTIATNLLMPLLFALPALGLAAWWFIRRSLRPLYLIGSELHKRRPDNLSPVAASGAPAEVLPLVESLNGLFARVGNLIENERRFTADAAHELRTPLAALKTQAQVALGAVADTERRHALEQVIGGCDRAAHLVEQMLTLARLEAEQFGGQREPCDLRQLARQTVAELAPAALARQVELEFGDDGPLPLEGYPALIAVLMRNVIDNAMRYSPAASTVRVRVAEDGASSVFSVIDEGPGVAAAERARLGQRFYRVLGSGQSGSGLGLSIVYRIAEIHGAAVRIAEGPNGKGLEVRIVF